MPTRSNDAVAEKFRPAKKERLQRTVVIDRPLIPDSRRFCYRSFDEVAERAKKLVLRDWNLICSESKIQISKYEVPYLMPKFDIFIDSSLAFSLLVFGWLLAEDSSIYKDYTRSLRNITISDLIKRIEGQVLCQGHSSDAFSGLSTRHIIPCRVDPFSEEEFPDPFPYEEYTRAESCIIFIREGIIC